MPTENWETDLSNVSGFQSVSIIYLYICQSASLSVCQSVSVYLSICLSVCLSHIHPSVHP